MDEILFSVDSGIAQISINRPAKSNALSPGMLRELRRNLNEAGEDRKIRIITITGTGDRVFCAGVDLKSSLSGAAEQAFGPGDLRQLLLEIVQCHKPVVTIVRGHVMGGGIGIVLASDICLACEDVYFSTPEIKVGMFPMMVMGLLYRNVGRKKATEMMFLGDKIMAPEARELGIINHAYKRGSFDLESGNFLRNLAAQSSTILSMGKKSISKILDESLASDEQYLESALAEVMATEDSKEGRLAFVEKRAPRWN